MARFQKGTSGNHPGRPKGAKNRATKELREIISDTLSREMSETKLRALLAGLDPAQKLGYLIKLADFVLPRLQAQNLNVSFDKLSESEIEKITDEILKNIEK